MIFLTMLPLWLSGLILVGLGTLLGMAGTIIVRRKVGLEKLGTNNEVAGFKFATVGVLYAVLLAFAVIIVWEKFNDADSAVSHEAGAATTIYRLSQGLGDQPGAALREHLTAYINTVIAADWPAMESGQISPTATKALNELYGVMVTFSPTDNRDANLMAEILHQLDAITEARRDRLVLAAGAMPNVIWLTLVVGAVLTVAFTFFFGTKNLSAQVLMTGALSILIFSGLLIIVAIDHPFTGSVKVEPDALVAVLQDFAKPAHP